MKAPAFQFYVQDFLTGTINFNAEEVGAYLLLMCRQWDKGYILESEIEEISRLPLDKLTRVLSKFKKSKKGYFNQRLEISRTQKEKSLKTFSENGKKGAKKRWDKDLNNNQLNGGATKTPVAIYNSSSSPSSSTSISKQQVIEFLRRDAPISTQQWQIEQEADKFISKFQGEKIRNLSGLCGSWAAKIIPSGNEKKMVI